MYEEALNKHEQEGNVTVRWVQEYNRDTDALLFTASQFSRYQDAELWLEAQFANKQNLIKVKK